MPEGYAVPYDDPGSVGEQLLGRGDGKRSTKTFIEDGTLAMFLGFVRGMPDSMVNVAKHLHSEQTGQDFQSISAEQIFREYPEASEVIGLHQQIVEHKGSQGGFTVTSYVGTNHKEEMDRKESKKETSGESKKGSRWA